MTETLTATLTTTQGTVTVRLFPDYAPKTVRNFVELAEGVEGLCHFSEVPGFSGGRRARDQQPPLAVGEERDFKIIKLSEAEKKIGLSLRAAADDEEKTRLEDYQRQAAAATTTIEEVMSLKDRNIE